MLSDGRIKLGDESQTKQMVSCCQLVDEVLYKFSYQKLYKFCAIPEFGKLFNCFNAICAMDTDEDTQKIIELIKSYMRLK